MEEANTEAFGAARLPGVHGSAGAEMRMPTIHEILHSKITRNAIWLASDKIIKMVVGVLVGAWVARYLAPARYGLLNYAIALVALFASVSPLGVKALIVRNIVSDDRSAKTELGTALVMQIGASLFIGVLTVSSAWLMGGQGDLIWVVSILSLGQVARSSEALRYWFEAHLETRRLVLVENGSFIAAAAVRVIAISSGATFLVFVWLIAIEAIVSLLAVAWLYGRVVGPLRELSFSFKTVVGLMRESWPLLLSSAAIAAYMKIDQVMVGRFLGINDVGVYAAAVRISEAWYFVPLALVASIAPALVRTRRSNHMIYTQHLRYLYRVMFYMAAAVAILVTVVAEPMVLLLYGHEYAKAAPILKIHCWAGVFVAVGVANAQWLLLEHRLIAGAANTLVGAAVSVTLNYIMLPRVGAVGAAIATVVSYGTSSTLMLWIWPGTRVAAWEIVRAVTFAPTREY